MTRMLFSAWQPKAILNMAAVCHLPPWIKKKSFCHATNVRLKLRYRVLNIIKIGWFFTDIMHYVHTYIHTYIHTYARFMSYGDSCFSQYNRRRTLTRYISVTMSPIATSRYFFETAESLELNGVKIFGIRSIKKLISIGDLVDILYQVAT